MKKTCGGGAASFSLDWAVVAKFTGALDRMNRRELLQMNLSLARRSRLRSLRMVPLLNQTRFEQALGLRQPDWRASSGSLTVLYGHYKGEKLRCNKPRGVCGTG